MFPPVVPLARFLTDVNPSEHIGDTDITITNECPSESHLEGVDKVTQTWYNYLVEVQKQ